MLLLDKRPKRASETNTAVYVQGRLLEMKNAAELYNSLVAKFVGDKRTNFSMKGSYNTRCEAEAISYNVPPGEFPRYIHKKLKKHSPGVYTKTLITSEVKRRQ